MTEDVTTLREIVRIGCGASFWGDSPAGPAKALAQVLMDFPVKVPADWTGPGGPLAGLAENGALA